MNRSLSAAAVACFLISPAFAQDAAPATSARCTGVLCDLYYANKPAPVPGQPEAPDPTRLPCRDFVCGMFGGRTPEAPPPTAQPIAAPEQAPEAPKKAAHRKHRARTVAAVDAKADAAK